MEIGWGGGLFSVLLNLATREVHAYCSEATAEQFHGRYGGRCYYTSRSGLSGAGWVPDRIELVSVPTYRVDTKNPHVGLDKFMGEMEVGVPRAYRGHDPIPVQEWPVLVRLKQYGDATVAVSLAEFFEFLLAREDRSDLELQKLEFKENYVPAPGAQAQEFTGQIFVTRNRPGAPRKHLRKIVQALNPQLRFSWGEEVTPLVQNSFWTRLAMFPASDGRVYRFSRGGICRASYARQELETIEGLQAAVGPNVRVLAPSFYIQRRDDAVVAAGLFRHGDFEYDFEFDVDVPVEFARALAGDFQDLYSRCQAGAAEKHRQDEESRRQQAEWQAQREAEYRRTLEIHSDRPVTREEALRLGAGYPVMIAQVMGDGESASVADFAALEEGRIFLQHYLFPDRERRIREEMRRLAETDREGWFRQACEKHGEVMVTFADSRSAGNCEPGTRDFRDRVFPGRESVTLAELARYSTRPEVRRVIEYKLRQLGA
jgi:hypothetical protein